MKKRVFAGIPMVMLMGLIAACGSGSTTVQPAAGDAAPKQEARQEPVTLKLYTYQNVTNDEMFNDYIVEPLKKKYPYITGSAHSLAVRWYDCPRYARCRRYARFNQRLAGRD
jgi:hypothetical protein